MMKFLKKFDNYFEIERILLLGTPIAFVLFGAGANTNNLILMWCGGGWWILTIIFSICPNCGTSILFFSRFTNYSLFRAVLFNNPDLQCPKCEFPYIKRLEEFSDNEEDNYGDLDCSFYETNLCVFKKQFFYGVVAVGITSFIYFRLFFTTLDIIILTIGNGILGATICNYFIVKNSLKKTIFTLVVTLIWVGVNAIFLPNAIKMKLLIKELQSVKKKNDLKHIIIKLNGNELSEKNSKYFMSLLNDIEIYYPSHDSAIAKFNFIIVIEGKKFVLNGYVEKNCPNDIIFEVRPYLYWNNIKIRNGALLLKRLKKAGFLTWGQP